MFDETSQKTPTILKCLTTTEGCNIFICKDCMNLKSYIHLDQNELFKEQLEKELCFHAQAANILIKNEQSHSKEHNTKCQILPKKKNYLCFVHGDEDNDSGVVYSNGKTLRVKCYTCKGGDCCYHLRQHIEEFKQQKEVLDMKERDDNHDTRTTRSEKKKKKKKLMHIPF